MADLDDIAKKQKQAAELGKKLAREKDVDEIKRLSKEIKEKAKELEAAAQNMAEAATPKGGKNVGGEVRVVLTPDQRKRIVEQTGVGMDTLVITEEAAQWMARMPGMQKRYVEQMALRKAAESVMREEKDKAIQKLIKKLEAIPEPVPEIEQMIAQLKKDPDGMEKLGKELGKKAREAAKNQQPPED
jgi:hypothetical protein